MTKTMIKTLSVTVGAILAMTVLMPAVASAQPKAPVHTCGALVPTKGLATVYGSELCSIGDTTTISGIDKASDNVRVAQPYTKP